MLFAPWALLLLVEELRLEVPLFLLPALFEVLRLEEPAVLEEPDIPEEPDILEEPELLPPLRCALVVVSREPGDVLLFVFFRPRPALVDGCFMSKDFFCSGELKRDDCFWDSAAS